LSLNPPKIERSRIYNTYTRLKKELQKLVERIKDIGNTNEDIIFQKPIE